MTAVLRINITKRYRQLITVGDSSTLHLILQWDEPYFSVSGGSGSQVDLDLLIYIPGRTYPSLRYDSANTGSDPIEIAGFRGITSYILSQLDAKPES